MKKFGRKVSRAIVRARRDCRGRSSKKRANQRPKPVISPEPRVNAKALTREIGQMTVERAQRLVCPGRVVVGTIKGVVCFAYRVSEQFAKIAARTEQGDLFHWIEISRDDFTRHLDNWHRGKDKVYIFLRNIASRTRDQHVTAANLVDERRVQQNLGVPDWTSLINQIKPIG